MRVPSKSTSAKGGAWSMKGRRRIVPVNGWRVAVTSKSSSKYVIRTWSSAMCTCGSASMFQDGGEAWRTTPDGASRPRRTPAPLLVSSLHSTNSTHDLGLVCLRFRSHLRAS
jgi:hypothetical protein